MTKSFDHSPVAPWFIFNDDTFGFDADSLIRELWKTGTLVIRNTESESFLDAMRALITKIIAESIRYQDKDVKVPAKRLQIILNGNVLEIFLMEAVDFHLTRRSDSKWLLNGTYETGADFIGQSGSTIEAKVYYSAASMTEKIDEANTGNRYIFHNADFVCCYLINTDRFIEERPYHYQWLKKVNDKYELYNDPTLDNLTRQSMPERLPLCRCTENPITGEWKLEPFYKY